MKIIMFLITFAFCMDNDLIIYVNMCANYYDIPVEIICAIITVESEWKQYAVSSKGAVGLMQVTKAAYKDYVRLNPKYSKKWITSFSVLKTDPQANINVGSWYLKRICYETKGNWKDAVTAYFWGINHDSPTDTYYNKVASVIKN
jgi:soluble lytic murein transglycosylase-like protein